MTRLSGLALAGSVAIVLSAPAAFAAAEAEAGQSSTLPKIVNFTILAVILVFAIRKPLAGYLEARAGQIREQLSAARTDREEAARARALADRLSSSLEDEVEAARRRIAKSAEEEGGRIVAAAEEQARKISAAAEAELAAEVRNAERKLAADAAGAAVRLARKRLESTMSDDDHRSLEEAGIAAIRSS